MRIAVVLGQLAYKLSQCDGDDADVVLEQDAISRILHLARIGERVVRADQATVELVARAVAGHFGPLFDDLPKDRAELRRSVRDGLHSFDSDNTQSVLMGASCDALAALASPEPKGVPTNDCWQPIATAPEDTLVLLFCPNECEPETVFSHEPPVALHHICLGWFGDHWGGRKWLSSNVEARVDGWEPDGVECDWRPVEPTHWMPIPELPEPDGEARDGE